MVASQFTARLSPDAYIQMALQLAWFRTKGGFTATYETALTRLFHHGRTETIRALTNDSCDWVMSMCDTTVSVSDYYSVWECGVVIHHFTLAVFFPRPIYHHHHYDTQRIHMSHMTYH